MEVRTEDSETLETSSPTLKRGFEQAASGIMDINESLVPERKKTWRDKQQVKLSCFIINSIMLVKMLIRF